VDPLLLGLHNLARWLLVFGLLAVVMRSFGGWRSGRAFAPADTRGALLGMIASDVQLLLGLALYFFSSHRTATFMADPGAAMGQAELRFWGVEHASLMLLAVVSVHVGKLRCGRAATDGARHGALLTFYGLALVLVFAAMPWPFRALVGRSLLPF